MKPIWESLKSCSFSNRDYAGLFRVYGTDGLVRSPISTRASAHACPDSGQGCPVQLRRPGWAAANDYYEPNKETLAKLIKGWAEANDYIIANGNEAMESLQKGHYSQTPLADINESFKAQKMFTSRDWKRMYSDGTVTNWLQQSTDFFMANAGIKDFTPASKYFDPSLYLKTIA